MNIKRGLLTSTAVAATAWLAAGYLSSSSAQEKQRTTFFQAGGDEKPTSPEMKQAEIDYVKALLKVAQADLAKVKEANSKVPDTIPNSVVRSLENEVAEAEGRVNAMQGNKSAGDNPYVVIAKQSLDYAQQSLKQAQDANTRAAAPSAPPKCSAARLKSMSPKPACKWRSCSTTPRPTTSWNGNYCNCWPTFMNYDSKCAYCNFETNFRSAVLQARLLPNRFAISPHWPPAISPPPIARSRGSSSPAASRPIPCRTALPRPYRPLPGPARRK